MALPFLKDFKKAVSKIDTVNLGIVEPGDWLSFGNYALNRTLSGDFSRGIPLGRLLLLAGPSGSGKSYLASQGMRQAQLEGYHLLVLDSENALDAEYLGKIKVQTDEEHMTYVQVTTIEDVNMVLSEFFSGYIKVYGKDNKDAPKTLIVLDSLAMLGSSTEMENYDKGVIKGDQGQLAKRRKAMLRMLCAHIARLPIAAIVTDHVYPQDIMAGDGAWAITNSTKYTASIIAIITKLKLKEDGAVTGVRMRAECYKSRFAKLGSKVEFEVPYSTGMNPLSGLLELFEELGVVTKEGFSLTSTIDGEVIKFRPKAFTEEIAQKLMKHPLAQPLQPRDDQVVDFEDDTKD